MKNYDDRDDNVWNALSPLAKLFWISLAIIEIGAFVTLVFPIFSDIVVPCMGIPVAVAIPCGLFSLLEFLDKPR